MPLLRATSPSRVRFVAQIAAASSSALGLIALTGWWLNSNVLKSIVPGSTPLKPNIAVGFLFGGAALALLSCKNTTKLSRACATVLSGIIIALGALTLAEHFLGWNLSIDTWLIFASVKSTAVPHSARMMATTALCFVLIGSALFTETWFVGSRLRLPLVAGLSAALVIIGVLALSGFLLEILFGPNWNLLGMSLSGVTAAVGFMILGSGLLALLQDDRGLNWSLDTPTTVGFIVGILLTVLTTASAFNFAKRMLETTNRIANREAVIKEVQQVIIGMTDLSSDERAYIILGDEHSLEDQRAIRATITQSILKLRKLTATDPKQQLRLDRLQVLVAERIGWADEAIAARREQGFSAARTGLELSKKIVRLLGEMQNEEDQALNRDKTQAQMASTATFALLPFGVFLSLAVLSLGLFLLNGGVGERLAAHKALGERESQLHTIVENLDEGVVVSDLKGGLLHWNRAALELHGYHNLEQGLRSLTEFVDTFELITLDGTVLPVEQWPLARILRGENLHDLELRVRNIKADWECIFDYGGTLVHGSDNQPLMAIVTITDITERKTSEQRLREQADIINRARDAIIIRDFESDVVTFWNAGAEQLYGWSATEAIGQRLGVLLFSDSNERAALLQKLVSAGEYHGEIKHRCKDGREVIVDSRSTLIRNDDGSPRTVLGINSDVTEQKKLETQLLRAQRLESIGTLASGVAHDLNNVLTPVLMCAQVARTAADEQDRESALSMIEESARRGAGIVKQVLTFARGVEGERIRIKPNHLIEEMIDIAKKTFPKTIEISSRYPEDLWSIQGDPTQLHQVLLNLSINARDAMPSGGVLVIWAENVNVDENYAAMIPNMKPGRHVAMRVSDTGVGMPAAIMDKIFDPFFTTKEMGKGTGLGLSTTLGILKSHGGFISVYSELNKGTTFKMFLPADIDEEILSRETPAEVLRGHGEVILVVDDEQSILRVTKMILEDKGYRVLAAHDGREAIGIFTQEMNAIRAVLTDMSLPFMDGIALIRHLKEMNPTMPFIASTGQSEHAHARELEKLGVQGLLTKPYDTQKLLEALHEALAPKN